MALCSRFCCPCLEPPRDPALDGKPIGWRDSGVSDLVVSEVYRELAQRTKQLDQNENAAWREEMLVKLARDKELSANTSQYLWFGVPDHLKGMIWPLAAGARIDGKEAEQAYARAQKVV